MAQAKRTGQKRKSPARPAAPRARQPWGLLLIVLLSGVVLGALLTGYGPLGKGLKNYKEQWHAERQVAPPDAHSTDPEVRVGPVRTEKQFSFYDILEDDIGRVLPDDFPVEESAREKKRYIYILQVASFRSRQGAEELRAKLALKGFESVVEEKTGKYRVKMGPYGDRRKLKNARTQVQKTGFGLRPIGIQYRKK